MDVNWLEDFVCLARVLNFTRASSERHVTQPAFSRRIRSLEIWAGTPLVDRSTYPIRLTPAGEEFLPVAQDIVSTLIRNRDSLREHDRGGPGFQSFTAPHSVSINHLGPLIHELQGLIPDLRTRAVSDNLHACCQRLSEADCDFLLCHRHGDVPLSLDEGLYQRVDLGSENFAPFAACNEARKPLWRIGPNRRTPLLAYATGSFLGAVLKRILDHHGLDPEIRHVDAFAESLKSLVLAGAGVAWLPEASVRDELAAGRIARAGSARYSQRLSISVFTAPERLDEGGRLIWNYLVVRPSR